MARSLWIRLRAALLCLLLAGPAAAEDERYRLSWVRGKGAEECPSAEQLAASVRQRLGRDPFSVDAPRDIEGSVARIDEVWQARLNVLGPDGAVLGSRDLSTQAPTCSLLADAVTLAIALTIDPSAPLTMPENTAAAPPPEAAPAPAPARAEPAPPPVVVAPQPRAPVDRASSFGLGGSAKVGVLFGALPRPAPGGELGVDLRLLRRLRVALGLAFFGEVLTAGDEFALGLTTASLGACFDVVGRPHVGLDLCGELQGGALHVVVYAPDPIAPGERAWLAARLGPRLRWKLAPPVELVLGASAVVPFLRREFHIQQNDEPVFATPGLGFFAGGGLGASIP